MFGKGKEDKDNEDKNNWSDDVGEFIDKTFDRVHNAVNTYSGNIQDTLEENFPWLGSFNLPVSSPFFGGKEQSAENLWAFPVPSARQYDQCKDAGGTSAWNKEGVWRCLFGPDAKDKSWFHDYTGFLDWRREMYRAMAAKRKKEQEQWSQLWDSKTDDSPKRYIAEAEAERMGKKVVSSSISSETVTKDDGNLETKRVVKKWYDDGTCSVNESVSTRN